MIPYNQVITIEKQAGNLDDWGRPGPGEILTQNCRLDQISKIVRNNEGKEVVSMAHILMKGLVEVTYSDIIKWTDEIGNTYAKSPISIEIKRDLSGKPLVTAVSV